MIVDLDGFKDVNTAHGYPAGDAVLRDAAARLQHACGPTTWSRGSAVTSSPCWRPPPRPTRCACWRSARSARCATSGRRTSRLTASVGWVIYPDDAQSVDELIARRGLLPARREADRQGPSALGARLGSGRRGIVRRVRKLRVLHDSFEDDPALDAGVSRALMLRVAAGRAAGDAADRAARARRSRSRSATPSRTATTRPCARLALRASTPRCGSRAAAPPCSTTARWRSATPCPSTSRARASTSASSARRRGSRGRSGGWGWTRAWGRCRASTARAATA